MTSKERDARQAMAQLNLLLANPSFFWDDREESAIKGVIAMIQRRV